MGAGPIRMSAVEEFKFFGPLAFGVSMVGFAGESVARAVDKPSVSKPLEVLAKTTQSFAAGCSIMMGLDALSEEFESAAVDYVKVGFLGLCIATPLVIEGGKVLAKKYNSPSLDTVFSYAVKSVNTVSGIASSTLTFGPTGGLAAGTLGIFSISAKKLHSPLKVQFSWR